MPQKIPHAAHWGAFEALVEDGRVVGVAPFAQDPNPTPLIRSIPDAVHARARIARPAVREGWLRGERRGAERGRDRFVEVSWERALGLIAAEESRIRAEHGDASVFGGSYGWSSAGRYHHARGQLQRYLAAGGGYTTQVTNYSYGAGMTLMPHILGTNEVISGSVTDWAAIERHTKLMLCLGGLPLKNAYVTSGGAGAHEYEPWLRRIAAAGLRIVNISPARHDAPDFLNAEWVPIRPGTDTALLLGMAHTLLAEGREDRAFLASHCVGWETLRAYILGESDGAPKTAGWAAAITGIPEATITRLAREAAGAPTLCTATWSIQRAEHGEQPWWMLVALAAMLGRIGQPGQGIAFGYGSMNGMGTPRRDIPALAMPALRNRVDVSIPVARITELLERPGEVLQYNGRDITLPDIRLIWWAGGNPFHHHQDLARLARGFARADLIVVQEPWWTATARMADIVLPATTTLERNDIASAGRDRFLRAMKQAIPPVGQARNDVDILADLAEARGFRPSFTEQRDEGAWLRHLYGKWSRAAAVQGFDAPDFDSFWEAGFVEVPAPDQPYTQFAEFAADPVANPLDTPSGRIELYSETIARMGYAEVPGHPVWQEPREWQHAPHFPLHLLSYQPPTRLHGQLDMGCVAAEARIAGREPIWMNAHDAAERGLAEGDLVRVTSARGAALAGLRVTDGLRRGVAAMATGAWWEPRDGVCNHGNANALTQDVGTSRLGQGSAAQTCCVEIARHAEAAPPVAVHEPPALAAEAA
jgi:biotin/methionine sulfoxide reductase